MIVNSLYQASKMIFLMLVSICCRPNREYQKHYRSRRAGREDFNLNIKVPNRNYTVVIEKQNDNNITDKKIVLKCDTSLHDYSDIDLPYSCINEAYADCDEACSYEEFLDNCDYDIDYSEYDDEVCECFNTYLKKGKYKVSFKKNNKLISQREILIDKNTNLKL